VPNLRDVGGAPADGGRRVRPGVLYRSTQLANLADEDRSAIDALGLATVVDLRTAVEVQRAPDVDVDAQYVWLDVLRDYAMAAAVGVEDVFADPGQFEAVLRDGTAAAMMREAYLAMVDLDSARESYGRWLCDLAESEGPVLVHCTNGKDRTGWAVAVALLAVGVDQRAVLTDYLTTNEQLLPVMQGLMAGVAQQGIDPDLLLPVVGVREEYLGAALDRVAQMGGLFAYLDQLGVTEETRERLRDRLTE
jgi:protein-tyrosine phosphatase